MYKYERQYKNARILLIPIPAHANVSKHLFLKSYVPLVHETVCWLKYRRQPLNRIHVNTLFDHTTIGYSQKCIHIVIWGGTAFYRNGVANFTTRQFLVFLTINSENKEICVNPMGSIHSATWILSENNFFAWKYRLFPEIAKKRRC